MVEDNLQEGGLKPHQDWVLLGDSQKFLLALNRKEENKTQSLHPCLLTPYLLGEF